MWCRVGIAIKAQNRHRNFEVPTTSCGCWPFHQTPISEGIHDDQHRRVSFITAPEASSTQAVARFSVPANAVQTSGRTGIVYVISSEDRIEKRDVALGPQTQQGVTILSGLSAGDRLAAGDLSKLKDGDRVKIEDAP